MSYVAERERDYTILWETSVVDLCQLVNTYLDRGYVTVGGLVDRGQNSDIRFMQSVVFRYTEPA